VSSRDIAGGDPVASGLVANLNRPRANVIGIAILAAELTAKQLRLLHELMANAAAFVRCRRIHFR
jgi:putative tryptophan/tyrosine transport system substrate-binding protein